MMMMVKVMMVMTMIMATVIVSQRDFEFTLRNKCRRLCENSSFNI